MILLVRRFKLWDSDCVPAPAKAALHTTTWKILEQSLA